MARFDEEITEDSPEESEDKNHDFAFHRLLSGAAYAFQEACDYIEQLQQLDIKPELQKQIKEAVKGTCNAVAQGMDDPDNPKMLLEFSKHTNELMTLSEEAMLAIDEANNA